MVRVITIASLVLATACVLTGDVGRDEVARATSPDGLIDAVLVETNGGATTAFGYEVHIVPRGAEPSETSQAAFLYAAARGEGAGGANLRWSTPTSLSIEYLSARSVELMKPSAVVDDHAITVELVAGISDPNAPPGGMLYNLLGRPHDPR